MATSGGVGLAVLVGLLYALWIVLWPRLQEWLGARGRRRGRVAALVLYPVKSMRGIQVTEAPLCARGLLLDRLWMVVNAQNAHVTQHTHPAMALLEPRLDMLHRKLCLHAPGTRARDDLTMPLEEPRVAEFKEVTVWKVPCEAIDMGDEAAAWISDALGSEGLRIVRFADDFVRKTTEQLEGFQGQTGFADLLPIHLLSQASVDALDQRVPDRKITAERFRPNIIVEGCDAFDEDTWDEFQVGLADMKVVRHTQRCNLPSIDPQRGAFDGDRAVDDNMRGFRTGKHVGVEGFSKAGKLFFGVYCTHQDPKGVVRVGDIIRVSSTRENNKTGASGAGAGGVHNKRKSS